MVVLTLLLSFILILGIKLMWDFYQKNYAKRVIDHNLSAWIDIVLYAILVLFYYHTNWVQAVGSGITLLSFRWLLFDPLFNYMNGNAWDYCGENSAMDRAADHLDGDPDNQRCNYYLIIKAVLVAAGILIWTLG